MVTGGKKIGREPGKSVFLATDSFPVRLAVDSPEAVVPVGPVAQRNRFFRLSPAVADVMVEHSCKAMESHLRNFAPK